MEEIMNSLMNEDFGEKAKKILEVISYFGPDDIRSGMFTFLVIPSDLQHALNLLSEKSLVNLMKDGTVVRIDQETQTTVRKYLKDENRGETALVMAMKLITSNLTELDDFYHAFSVFSYSKEYSENVHLVEGEAGIASRVILVLKKMTRYGKADAFNFAKRPRGERYSATSPMKPNLYLSGAEIRFVEDVELSLPLYEMDVDIFNQKEVYETRVTVTGSLNEKGNAETLPNSVCTERLLENIPVTRAANTSDKKLLTAFYNFALLLNDLDFALIILKLLLMKRRESLDDEDIHQTMSSIAHVLRKQREYHEALNIFQQVYDERLIYLGDKHEDTLRTKRDIAVICMDLSDYDKAFKELGDVVGKFDQVLGELHPDTLKARAKLAEVLSLQFKLTDAHKILTDVCEKQKNVLGEYHIETLRVKYNIGSVLLKERNIEESLTVFEEVLEGFHIAFGRNHPETRKIQTEIDGKRAEILKLKSLFKKNLNLNSTVSETIHWHLSKGNFDVVACLINSGADVNYRDSVGNTPLHYAAKYKHFDLVQFLLAVGADYQAENKYRKTPLQIAESAKIKGFLSSIITLFENVKAGSFEEIRKSPSSTKWIVNVKDSTGFTPLHWAAFEGHHHILFLLFQLGADVTSVSNKGNTPLHIAVSKGHGETVTALLQLVRSEDMSDFINGRTEDGGNSPLHMAAERGFFDIVKTLLKSGAAYDIRNRDGKTPLEVAGDLKVWKLLHLVNSLFTDAKNGSFNMMELRDESEDVVSAIRNARDHQKHTLLQILQNNDNQVSKEDSSEKQEL